MKNPYWNRKMIRDLKYFFGREKEMEKIFAAIEAPHPQNILIVGERKIGKSSLLYYIFQSSIEKQKLAHPEKYVSAWNLEKMTWKLLQEVWKENYRIKG